MFKISAGWGVPPVPIKPKDARPLSSMQLSPRAGGHHQRFLERRTQCPTPILGKLTTGSIVAESTIKPAVAQSDLDILAAQNRGPSSAYPFAVGSSKPDNCSTCRRNTDGFISIEAQMSKMLRNDGFVLPSSIRLMKARSYPDFAASASWLIFNRVRCFRSSCPNAAEGSRFGLSLEVEATPQCGTASILRAAYNTFGRASPMLIADAHPSINFGFHWCACEQSLGTPIMERSNRRFSNAGTASNVPQR